MNSTINTIIKRKSTRSFKDQDILKEYQDLIIEAAINAPTAGNMQLYSIIKITKKSLLHKLSILCDNQPFIESAKLCLIFVADYARWQNLFKAYNLKPRDIKEGDLLLLLKTAWLQLKMLLSLLNHLVFPLVILVTLWKTMKK